MYIKITLPFYLLIVALFAANGSHAQGCVAIRNMSCTSGLSLSSNSVGLLNKGEWQALIGYRYFKSFRHFRGKHEEPERVENGTEVINYFNSLFPAVLAGRRLTFQADRMTGLNYWTL
jgi:hypothetical protein